MEGFMETLIQTTKEGIIRVPDFVKIRVGDENIVFDNKDEQYIAKRKNAEKVLEHTQRMLSGISEELNLANENDDIAAIREIRYGEPFEKDF